MFIRIDTKVIVVGSSSSKSEGGRVQNRLDICRDNVNWRRKIA